MASIPNATTPSSGRTVLRQVVPLAACVALTLGAVACGSDDDDDSANTSPPAAESAATESPETATSESDTTVASTEATAESTESTESTVSTESAESTESTETTAPVEGDLDAAQAADVALALTAGFVFEIDQDDDGPLVWEILIRQDDGSGVEHDIEVATGAAVSQQSVSVPSEAATAPAVTVHDAIDIALDTVPDGAVVEADLTTEDSVIVWDVLVLTPTGGETELDIDASSGSVIKTEVDD